LDGRITSNRDTTIQQRPAITAATFSATASATAIQEAALSQCSSASAKENFIVVQSHPSQASKSGEPTLEQSGQNDGGGGGVNGQQREGTG
jgi:hypothetical protein